MEKEYDITIRQILEGHVKIKANSPEEAEAYASRIYAQEGTELPDMDDGFPLEFSAQELFYPAPSREEVEDYFKRNGRPDADKDWIDNFICHPNENRREQYWEAVANNYELCEFDRWQHLQDVFNAEVPWDCFCTINNALYENDIEILELGYHDRPGFQPEAPVKTSLDSQIGAAATRSASQQGNNTINTPDLNR